MRLIDLLIKLSILISTTITMWLAILMFFTIDWLFGFGIDSISLKLAGMVFYIGDFLLYPEKKD